MKFFAVITPFLLTVAPVLASPLEASGLDLLKDDIDNLPRRNIQCGGASHPAPRGYADQDPGRNARAQTYSPSEIEKTAAKALVMVAEKKQIGPSLPPVSPRG
jgi:hypothetical protein